MRLGLGCVVLAFACATSPGRSHPVTAPTARSSIDAVLQHTGELQLTEDQRQALISLDAKRDGELEQRRAERRLQHEERTAGDNTRHRGGRDPMRVGGGAGKEKARRQQHLLVDQLDDTSFHEAEKLLTDDQLPRARELAAQYREELSLYRNERSEE